MRGYGHGLAQVVIVDLGGVELEVVFEDDVVLKKVPRSEQAPNGVLVQDWNESLFKK